MGNFFPWLRCPPVPTRLDDDPFLGRHRQKQHAVVDRPRCALLVCFRSEEGGPVGRPFLRHPQDLEVQPPAFLREYSFYVKRTSSNTSQYCSDCRAKTAENEHNAKYTKLLRQVIGVILDLRIDCHSNPADNPGHQPHANRKCPGTIDMMDESAANESRGYISQGWRTTVPQN